MVELKIKELKQYAIPGVEELQINGWEDRSLRYFFFLNITYWEKVKIPKNIFNQHKYFTNKIKKQKHKHECCSPHTSCRKSHWKYFPMIQQTNISVN